MKLGISSACFYPLDTIQSLIECINGGFSSAEIFVNTHSELDGPYFENMKSVIEKNKMSILSIHPFTSGYENVLFFSGYERRIEDGIEYYKKYFNMAADLGAKFVVFHGNNMKTKFCGFERYCEIFERINDTAHKFGVELIHENTTWSIAREGDGIRQLLKCDPYMKFVFDAKQACRGGYDPYDVLDAMGNNVVHVHINDWIDGHCAPPYSGNLRLDDILKRLSFVNYGGDMVIEVYRENFDTVQTLSKSAEELTKRLSLYFKVLK